MQVRALGAMNTMAIKAKSHAHQASQAKGAAAQTRGAHTK